MPHAEPIQPENTGTTFGQICCAAQPDNDKHHCIMLREHEGPHRSFVGVWTDGDATAVRRPRPRGAAGGDRENFKPKSAGKPGSTHKKFRRVR